MGWSLLQRKLGACAFLAGVLIKPYLVEFASLFIPTAICQRFPEGPVVTGKPKCSAPCFTESQGSTSAGVEAEAFQRASQTKVLGALKESQRTCLDHQGKNPRRRGRVICWQMTRRRTFSFGPHTARFLFGEKKMGGVRRQGSPAPPLADASPRRA